MRGLGVLTGIEVVDVPGATAGFDNDYGAQTRACLDSLQTRDLFLLHVEATDEAGHQGDVAEKVRALERWDADIIGPIAEALAGEPHRILLLPDHATPCASRTHTSDPVPYLLYDAAVVGPGGTLHRVGGGDGARRGRRLVDGPPRRLSARLTAAAGMSCWPVGRRVEWTCLRRSVRHLRGLP